MNEWMNEWICSHAGCRLLWQWPAVRWSLVSSTRRVISRPIHRTRYTAKPPAFLGIFCCVFLEIFIGRSPAGCMMWWIVIGCRDISLYLSDFVAIFPSFLDSFFCQVSLHDWVCWNDHLYLVKGELVVYSWLSPHACYFCLMMIAWYI